MRYPTLRTKITFGGLLVTLGIVFGDIGTSPLYVFSAIVQKNLVTEELVYGGLSCIFWTLTLQATFKYIFLTLRADNHGEGGVFSLYSLIKNKAPKWAVYVAMLGCAALLADGIITPAITLTASIEGLQLLSPNIPVVPIVIVILIGLFSFQQFGTEKIGKLFGPIMMVWFSMLAVLGFLAYLKHPSVVKALNPWYAYHVLTSHPSAWFIVGAVFLCVTGAEALYSDLGHVGKKNIRITWVVVKSALLMNYFGQGAWLLSTLDGKGLGGINPFYAIMPEWFVAIGVVVASFASIVASQALISGSFSLISEAVKLDTWFKVHIVYPTAHRQQLFIPMVNHILFLGCLFIVLHFRESANMEAAYGIAITIAMLSTTILLVFYLKHIQHWDWIRIGLVTSLFLSVEGVFFVGNVQKIAHGAGVTLALMALFFIVMIVHYEAKRLLKNKRKFVDVHHHSNIIRAVSEDVAIPKFATNIVYLTTARQKNRIEKQILKSIYEKQPKRADAYWLIHFNEVDEPFKEEYKFSEIMPGKIFRIDFNLGYKVNPNVKQMFTEALKELARQGVIKLENKYESLRKHNIPADFLFIIMRNTFNLSSDTPMKEVFLLNSYKALQRISQPPEEYLGIDRNALQVEFIALK